MLSIQFDKDLFSYILKSIKVTNIKRVNEYGWIYIIPLVLWGFHDHQGCPVKPSGRFPIQLHRN